MAIDRNDLVAESADLYRFALSITRDPVRAADLSQDTIIRALERENQFRTGADLGPWLRRIAHNLAIDRARRGQREILVEEAEDLKSEEEGDDAAVDADANANLNEILGLEVTETLGNAREAGRRDDQLLFSGWPACLGVDLEPYGTLV